MPMVSMLLVALLLPTTSSAQDGGSSPSTPPAPCSAPEYRQFDFWLGDWDVHSKSAQGAARPPAHNRISSSQGGCVLVEEYETPSGYTGQSLSYYDSRDSKWHQVWIDNGGAPVVQSGGLNENGEMVLLETGPSALGVGRITWTPLANGDVRQLWQRSTDGGATWSTIFDGTYSRREPSD